jgi:hypothetical protein
LKDENADLKIETNIVKENSNYLYPKRRRDCIEIGVF